MKKIKLLFAVCASLFLMTGCIKYNATMEVKKDKSMDFSIIYAMDMSSLDGMGDDISSSEEETIDEEQKKELEKQGYKVEDYKEGNYKGSKITVSFDNIDDVSKEDDFNLDLSGMLDKDSDNKHFFVVKKGFLKNTYKAVYKFDTNNSDEESSETTMDMTPYLKNMDLKFTVKLPNAANSNNATSVDGTTYTWDLTQQAKSDINFEFDMWNMTNVYIIIGAAVLLLVAIIVVVVLVVASSKKKA